MENQIRIFDNQEFGKTRVIMRDGYGNALAGYDPKKDKSARHIKRMQHGGEK